MYKAFNLGPFGFERSYLDEGNLLNEANISAVKKTLEPFIANGKIDGTKLRDHWFPEIDAHVFISHSHKDQAAAKNLAGYIKKWYGLNSFIDSCVWGYADDLLRQFDNEYCWNKDSNTYIYENRNGSTAHIHMMLATALTEMIDRCECVIFMNTPNSITSTEVVDKTHSPWIYFELGVMKLLREQTPRRLIKESTINMSRGTVTASLPKVDYSVDLSTLTDITFETLNKWQKLRFESTADDHSLDLLYKAASGNE